MKIIVLSPLRWKSPPRWSRLLAAVSVPFSLHRLHNMSLLTNIEDFCIVSRASERTLREILNRRYQMERDLEDARLPGRRGFSGVTIRGSNIRFW